MQQWKLTSRGLALDTAEGLTAEKYGMKPAEHDRQKSLQCVNAGIAGEFARRRMWSSSMSGTERKRNLLGIFVPLDKKFVTEHGHLPFRDLLCYAHVEHARRNCLKFANIVEFVLSALVSSLDANRIFSMINSLSRNDSIKFEWNSGITLALYRLRRTEPPLMRQIWQYYILERNRPNVKFGNLLNKTAPKSDANVGKFTLRVLHCASTTSPDFLNGRVCFPILTQP